MTLDQFNDVRALLDFAAKKYPNQWHSYKPDWRTTAAITRAERMGAVIVSRARHQFMGKSVQWEE